jgi:Protein of unknown function (DUF1826)
MAKSRHNAAEQYGRPNDLEHAVERSERIGLTHILRPEINLAVWQRRVPTAISIWLSRFRVEDLLTGSHDIDRALSVEDVAATLLSDLRWHDPVAEAGVTALAHDAKKLAVFFAQLSGTSSVRLRLDWATEQQCPRIRADRVPMRLLCTYRGPGTEWIANDVTLASPDVEPPKSMLNRFGTGDVAIMKGSLSGGSAGPLRHRSPPLKCSAEWQLLLTLDPLSPDTAVRAVDASASIQDVRKG